MKWSDGKPFTAHTTNPVRLLLVDDSRRQMTLREGRLGDIFGDVFGGALKGAVFAISITLIACQRGLSTRGGAAGVGASTTSAVVTILFMLVALDMLFTIFFAQIGI